MQTHAPRYRLSVASIAPVRPSPVAKMPLRAMHSIGRDPASSLCIIDPLVSFHHAAILWTGTAWVLRDENSSNGCYINGAELPQGEIRELKSGQTLGFGSLEQAWQVSDLLPPRPGLICLTEPGTPALLLDVQQATPVPNRSGYNAFVYAEAGVWMMQVEGHAPTPLSPNTEVCLGADRFMLDCPMQPMRTQTSSLRRAARSLSAIHLDIVVPRDQHGASLQVAMGSERRDVGSCAELELVAFLAQKRKQDTAQGFDEAVCGWVNRDEAVSALGLSSHEHLNKYVHVCRSALGKAGVSDAQGLIERDQNLQLRIGVAGAQLQLQQL